MFTTLRRSRRPVAVLAALALVAGMLAAAPAVGDEHPEADFTATFSACEGVGSSDFTDVPAGHSSAGSIDCIAYYGITKGTGDGTTYSPAMSVTREHMALFLTRLAGLVDIDMAADPPDAGFTDIGELSTESQTAINQLADLGVTQGTNAAGTTYSPADAVQRGHMALFIQRLMNLMDPMANGDTAYGHTPSDVAENENDEDIGTPFNDIRIGVAVDTNEAITQLWELGVASGISDTAYGPKASITRAAMADFMAAVLDHSNVRPAGVTAQVTKSTDFGSVDAVMAVSVRDDSFAPMAEVAVASFTATQSGGFNEDTGKCETDDVCDWNESLDPTDDSGNLFSDIDVVTDDGEGGTGNMENSETWYAWVGDEDNSEFVKDESGEASVTLTAKPQALGIRVTTDISDKATTNQVDIGEDRSVVVTAQLIDTATATDDSNDVAKEGVELTIARTRGATADAPGPGTMKTDADGKVTFTIEGPEDPDDDTTITRDDTVTFTGDVDGDTTDPASPDNEEANVVVQWRNADGAVDKAEADAPSYTIIDDDEVTIRVDVSYFDQYGNPGAAKETLTITIDNPDVSGDDGQAVRTVRVRSNGTASFSGSMEAAAGADITITVTTLSDSTGVTAPTAGPVVAVRHAHKNDDGVVSVITEDTDNDRFIVDTADNAGILYSYDSGDTFIVDDKAVDMDAFEEAIDNDGADGVTVDVVFYSVDGISIFSVTSPSG